MRRPIAHIIDRHVEDAAFLWLQREDACLVQPHYQLADLVALDNRLAANLDGVAVAGKFGLDVAVDQAMKYQAPGEIFVATWSAIWHSSGKHLDQMIALSEHSEECWQAMVSGLAWHPADVVEPFLSKMGNSDNLQLFLLAAEVKFQQGQCPDHLLKRLLAQTDPRFNELGLKAIGQLKLTHWLEKIRHFQIHENQTLQFWASWSTALLEDSSDLAALKAQVMTVGQFAEQAIAVLACKMASPVFNELVRSLFSQPDQRLLALSGAGFSGDPLWVNGLLKYMDDPTLSRRAGEAFSMITGADLAYLDLDKDWPEGIVTGPTESASDSNVDLDPDESLAWPDSHSIARWWQQRQHNYAVGSQYLCGKVVTGQQCLQVLEQGYQRQRRQAALRLAILGQPLFAVDAPAQVQQVRLKKLRQNPWPHDL